MRATRCWLVLLLVGSFLIVGSVPARAAEGGWTIPKLTMPSLWPFGEKKNSKLMSEWPGKGSSKKKGKKSSKQKGSKLSQVTSGTKKAWGKTWQKTKSIATLGASDKKKRKHKRPASSRSKPKSKISLAGFFKEAEKKKPAQARTPIEFLKQGRPGGAFGS